MRYFLEFSYNGTHYCGWQIQPDAASVQGTLQKSLSTLLGETITIVGAGRTDTGVHAKLMYAHFDTEAFFEIPVLLHRLNSFLPQDIAVSDIIPTHDDAHARFDATARTYEYHIHTKKNVFLEQLSWQHSRRLDLEQMNLAARQLLLHEDFESFSKTNTDVRTFRCNITEAHWEQLGDRLIFTISADRFLRNMVRAIVGTLIQVGLGKTTVAQFNTIIESKNRSKAGFSVPAKGLYLVAIKYDYIKPPATQSHP
ncbi:tRNA pseudouridine(38-40) synthase TruA [Flavobacterium selenitireducens]|uniref:tRNA pseudouridine(38-40) synthase TruA n=1 Tax=Flavobacterium selenitireducens TaxID=2722704 RepID=UPI00168A9D2A|nr:tRNA pseudouridine(38-40) synthase TruA [Flavobacterium selenitireducens]MBD3581440.1 tRNA pseudouridine(38-40) synthase TruA [Flavobacterium selenitireducens]